MRPEIPRNVRKIAILRALHLGDLLLAVPAFRGFRRAFPDAEITLIALPWAADFAARFCHYIDRLLEFPGYPGLLEVDVHWPRTEAFIAEARRYDYDLAIQLHGSGRTSNPFVLELGARCTVGYYEEEAPSALAIGAPYPADQPEVLRNLGMLDLLGLPMERPQLEFPLLPADIAKAEALIAQHGLAGRRLLGLHVGSRPPARRWPTEHFAIVGDTLADWFGLTVVLTGSPDEREIAEQVRSKMCCPVINLAGETNLGSLAALIDRTTLFISNDTGPAHVAVALDVPSIAIFGPADRRRWAPLDHRRHRIVYRDVECSPCVHWECPIDHRCLRWIDVNAVLQAAADLLALPASGNGSQQGTRSTSCAA